MGLVKASAIVYCGLTYAYAEMPHYCTEILQGNTPKHYQKAQIGLMQHHARKYVVVPE